MLKRIDYDEHQHAVYAKGRTLSPDMRRRWFEAFEAAAPPSRPLSVLDLGSGIGRFTPGLAEVFGGPVFGVEPAARMRAIAERDAHHKDVRYLAGGADHIPLPDASMDVVLMFLSFHHFPDRKAAVAEIARVLRPDGRVLLRSTFSDNIPDLWWRPFFPRTWAIEAAMFPSVAEAQALFAEAGIARAELVKVEIPFRSDLATQAAQLRLRPLSVLEHLTDEEWTQGLARMDAALAAGEVPTPAAEHPDFLVLSRA